MDGNDAELLYFLNFREKFLDLQYSLYTSQLRETIFQLISWPTLFFFEVASSLIVLDCTLRKIQPNIQGGGA